MWSAAVVIGALRVNQTLYFSNELYAKTLHFMPKHVRSFCIEAQNISMLDIILTRRLYESLTNDFIKLTMFRTARLSKLMSYQINIRNRFTYFFVIQKQVSYSGEILTYMISEKFITYVIMMAKFQSWMFTKSEREIRSPS